MKFASPEYFYLLLQLNSIFNKAKIDNVSVSTTDDYVTALTKLFKQRAK